MSETNEEKIVQNVELLNRLVETFPNSNSDAPENRREAVFKMLRSVLGTQFCTAPASSRAHFHECYPGGLLQHSLNVVKNVNRLANALCPGVYPAHRLAFVALFHDLGKAGDGISDYYVPTPEKWKRDKGELYQTNSGLKPFMTVSDRTLFLLQHHGIELTAEELVALRLADGQYEESNKPYKSREPHLALLLHWSDHNAMMNEKREFQNPAE